MQFGVNAFPTDYSMPVADVARALEERGFESLFVAEHTHIPTSRRTPWPGGELPREYLHLLDPFVALAAAASVTARLKLGTGVCLVIERDPITLAKAVASLDHLSRGRFLFGVGAGWLVEEMEHHGTDPTTRWALLRERIAAMKAIWTQDQAEYHGRYVNFDPVWSWPKPVQQPHPPVIIGGGGPHVLQRVVTYGDGWLPVVSRGSTGEQLIERMNELQQLAQAAGRPRIPVSVACWDLDAALFGRLARAGVERCLVALPSVGEAEALPFLDRYAAVAKQAVG